MSNNTNKQRQIAIPPPSPSLTDKKLYFSYGSGFSLRTGSKLSSGFTIIEVALVLAIAGLIFLVVFLALPALQNSQKDMARREDVGRVVAMLENYKTDHNGDISDLGLPLGTWYGIGSQSRFAPYMRGLSQANQIIIWDSGSPQTVRWLNNAEGRNSTIGVSLNHSCSDLGLSSSSDNNSTPQAAVWYLLTNGKDYCVNM